MANTAALQPSHKSRLRFAKRAICCAAMKFLAFPAVALALSTFATPAAARVDASSDAGFAVVHEVDIAATPTQLWLVLTRPSSWWSKGHTWSGDAANLWMVPRQGGCFCETLPLPEKRNGRRHPDSWPTGFVQHASVIYARPDQLLRLSGVLGPLQSEGLTGTLSFAIAPVANGTSKLKLDYVVGGYSRIPLKSVAPAVDAVLAEQVARLKAASEQAAKR